MIVFYVIVGISALGVAAVFFLLSKEKGDEQVEPFPMDSLKEREPLNLSKKVLLEPEVEAAPKKSNPFAKFKMPGKKKEAAMPSDFPLEPKAGKPKFQLGDALSKLKGKLPALKKKTSDSEDEDIEQASSSAKKNPLQGILSKFKLGKKKVAEDAPTTNFASLKEKLNQFSKGAPKEVDDKPLPLRKDTGTSSLKTLAEEPEVEALSEQEKRSIDNEVDAATELAELKGKYGKMEKLLSEKNSELEKNKTSFDSEVGHRKDFNKIKDLLEKELKEVKERVKTVRQDHVNAVQEKDNALRRIKQLDEKSTKLEKEILGLEKENDQLRRQIKQAGLKEPPKMAPVVDETPPPSPVEEPPPAAPAAAAPMDLPPAFKEVQTKSKINKDDISKFEESLGFSSHEVAAEVPLTPSQPPPEPPIETPKPVEEPPAAIVEPPAPVVEEPPAPVVEAPAAVVAEPPPAVVEPPAVEVPAPPAAPEPPAPPPPVEITFEEPTPPEREDDDDEREGGGFLKLSPDPMSDPSAPKPPQEPSPDKPEDKKE